MVMGKATGSQELNEKPSATSEVLRTEIETFKKFHRCVSTCLDLGGLPLDQQQVSKLMGAIVSLLHSSTHMSSTPSSANALSSSIDFHPVGGRP